MLQLQQQLHLMSTRLFSALLAFTPQTYHKKSLVRVQLIKLKLLPKMFNSYLVTLGCHLDFKFSIDSSVSFCFWRRYVSCFCSVSSRVLPQSLGIREAPLTKSCCSFGHCPNSDWTPLHSNRHSGALFCGRCAKNYQTLLHIELLHS